MVRKSIIAFGPIMLALVAGALALYGASGRIDSLAGAVWNYRGGGAALTDSPTPAPASVDVPSGASQPIAAETRCSDSLECVTGK